MPKPKYGIEKESNDRRWMKFRDDDISALGDIFRTHFNELYFYGLKIVPLPDLVKDTIQDVFVTVWERRSSLGDVQNSKAYLLTILRRELLQKIKKERKEVSCEALDYEQFIFSAEDFLIHQERSQELGNQLKESFAGLSARQREVVLLRFYHSLEFGEIAEILQINIQSVRNLLFRAIEKIRGELFSAGENCQSVEQIELFLWVLFSSSKKSSN